MHRCSDCTPVKYFKDRSNFHRHCRALHLQIRYQCGSCPKDFSRRTRKEEHEATCRKEIKSNAPLELVAPSPGEVDLSVDPDSCELLPVHVTRATRTHIRFDSDEEEAQVVKGMEVAAASGSSEESGDSSSVDSSSSDSCSEGSSSEEKEVMDTSVEDDGHEGGEPKENGQGDGGLEREVARAGEVMDTRVEDDGHEGGEPEENGQGDGGLERELAREEEVLELKYCKTSNGVVRCWVEAHGGKRLVRERCRIYIKNDQGEAVGRVVFDRDYSGQNC